LGKRIRNPASDHNHNVNHHYHHHHDGCTNNHDDYNGCANDYDYNEHNVEHHEHHLNYIVDNIACPWLIRRPVVSA
jgi:hypothetical protein